jgi:hypothetical protein
MTFRFEEAIKQIDDRACCLGHENLRSLTATLPQSKPHPYTSACTAICPKLIGPSLLGAFYGTENRISAGHFIRR